MLSSVFSSCEITQSATVDNSFLPHNISIVLYKQLNINNSKAINYDIPTADEQHSNQNFTTNMS